MSDAAAAVARDRGPRAQQPVSAWATWPMPNPAAARLPHESSYEISNKGTVLDKVTGLMWQRAVPAASYPWNEALDHCASLDLAGFHDWRLPSRIELVSLIDLTCTQPSIDGLAFPHTPNDWFWTSSVDAAEPQRSAWYVYFYFGYPKTDPMTTPYRARCVRTPVAAGQGSAAPAYDIAKDVVRDKGTGLTWQRAAPEKTYAFDQARAYCAGLRLAGQKDWRVPSMGELLTLVDERVSAPTIDGKAFPHTPNQSFWTSSPFADSPSAMAWHVYFEFGNALYGLWKGPYRVRCVR